MIDIGIDLGTTFSLASHVNAQFVPALVPDIADANEFRTPSVVHVGTHACLVGNAAEQMLSDEPRLSVARFFKLRLGEKEPVYVDERQRGWYAESLSALVLRKLLRDVDAALSEDVSTCLLAVPAAFGDVQRRATRAAAMLAGLREVQLIEEPVAAAVYYGLTDASRDQTLLVYDFGGGTFDSTLLQAAPSGVYAIATEGTEAGGKDVDEALVELIASEFRRQHGTSPFADPAGATHVLRVAREMKLAFGKPETQHVRKTLLVSGKTLDLVVPRRQFDMIVAPLVERTLAACEKTLTAGGLSWNLVDRVLLTGGSSLLPQVLDAVRRRSGKSGDAIVCRQPHQAVAFGAGMLAAARRRESSAEPAPAIQPVSSFGLGIRVFDRKIGAPRVQVLIPRNSPLPARNTATFYTTRDDQVRMIVEVVQQRTESEERSLGHFAFGPLKHPRKNYPVEITVSYDVEGVVSVTARDGQTDQRIERVMAAEDGALHQGLLEQKALLEALPVNG